jgi:hypothetical protein
MTSKSLAEAEQIAAEEYMAHAAPSLEFALSKINGNPLAFEGMDYKHQVFGITKNRETFSIFALTSGHYHSVGFTSDKLSIIVFVEGGRTGFGLFNQDKSNCLPIDFDELIIEIMREENPVQQRTQVERIIRNLEAIDSRAQRGEPH